MKHFIKHLVPIILCLALIFTATRSTCTSIAYKLNNGQFGDNLTTYCKSLFLSYRYNLSFFFKQFKHSTDLCLESYDKELPTIKTLSIHLKHERERKQYLHRTRLLATTYNTNKERTHIKNSR